jgi:tetratricopeptide (TPR) repeat protein
MDKPSRRDQAILTATRGLIEFKEGNLEAGRNLYRQSIQQLRRTQPTDAALAAMYWAYEEYLIQGEPESAIAYAEKVVPSELKNPDVILVHSRLDRFKR